VKHPGERRRGKAGKKASVKTSGKNLIIRIDDLPLAAGASTINVS
jgi:hypothetical protein